MINDVSNIFGWRKVITMLIVLASGCLFFPGRCIGDSQTNTLNPEYYVSSFLLNQNGIGWQESHPEPSELSCTFHQGMHRHGLIEIKNIIYDDIEIIDVVSGGIGGQLKIFNSCKGKKISKGESAWLGGVVLDPDFHISQDYIPYYLDVIYKRGKSTEIASRKINRIIFIKISKDDATGDWKLSEGFFSTLESVTLAGVVYNFYHNFSGLGISHKQIRTHATNEVFLDSEAASRYTSDPTVVSFYKDIADKLNRANSKVTNPEEITHTKRSMLGRWLRGDLFNETISAAAVFIQKISAPMSFHNEDALKNFHLNIASIVYGTVFPNIEAIELPFLEYIHNASKIKSLITMEVAAGTGFVSWKVPYAFENNSIHYVIEPNKTMIKIIEVVTGEWIKGTTLTGVDLRSLLQKETCSFFDILKKHPHLKHKVNAIYVQNLEHLLNPVQHRIFLELIADLLAPGGKAFLTAQPPHPRLQLYIKENPVRMQLSYPWFLKFNESWLSDISWGSMNIATFATISDVVQIPEDTDIGTTETGYQEMGFAPLPIINRYTGVKATAHVPAVRKVNVHLRNSFTKEVYREAVKEHPRLQLEETFYIGTDGKRLSESLSVDPHLTPPNALFVAAIILKKDHNDSLEGGGYSTSSLSQGVASAERNIGVSFVPNCSCSNVGNIQCGALRSKAD